jgi:hypothetical protein
MKEELKPTYRGKQHTFQVILDGEGFEPEQFPALLKSFVVNQWNGYQVNEDGIIATNEIRIIEHAYVAAEPNKWILFIKWEFL